MKRQRGKCRTFASDEDWEGASKTSSELAFGIGFAPMDAKRKQE